MLPYSIATVWSYAKRNPNVEKEYQLGGLYFIKKPVETVLNDLVNPDVCAFSCYVWNWKYNLELAKKIKITYPHCLIIFGGPQVPDNDDTFHQRYPWVDLLVHGEGEYQFLEVLLANLTSKPAFQKIPGISYLDEHANCTHQTSPPSRVSDLSDIPSPYTDGVVDDYIKDPHYRYAMVTETNRGCPFRCTFCNWGSLTYQKVKLVPLGKIREEFEWAAENNIDEIHLADANFGIFKERDREIAKMFIEVKEEFGYPWTISTAWTKNSNETVLSIADLLHKAEALRMFQISIQTFNEETLVAVRRSNMDSNKYGEVLKEVQRINIPHGTELIIGLALETYESWVDTIDQVCATDTWFHLSPLTILVNTEYASPEYKTRYGVGTRQLPAVTSSEEEYVEETQEIVVSTSTFSDKDMIKGWGYSWIIYAFHLSGFTNQIAKLLDTYEIPKTHFYQTLFKWISKETSGIFYDEYHRFLSEIKSTFAWQKASRLFLSSFYANRSAVDDALDRFLCECFPGVISNNLRAEIVRFQRFSSLDPAVNYPFSAEFAYNFSDAIESYEKPSFGPVRVLADNEWQSHPDFLDLDIATFMFRKRRNMPWKNSLTLLS
jgi:radical SAM superfamily enzyme YgiQ (UPF0313 family)